MAEHRFSSFADAEDALTNRDLAQALYDEGAQVMADALIVLHGEAHTRRRLAEFSIFKRDFFRQYERVVFPETLAPVLSDCVAVGEADLVEFGYRVTMNLSADFAGLDRPEGTAEETATLLALAKKFSEGATLVHSTRDRATVRREVAEAMTLFDAQFFEPSLQRRRSMVAAAEAGDLRDTELPRDVLTTLLRNESRLKLDREVLLRETAFYLQAGAHSSANATIRALHEIFTWRQKHPEAWRERQDDRLFIQRCVHESLRLYPASPVAWRRPVCPAQVGAEALEANDRVEIDLYTANRDTARFGEDAADFNPDRPLARNIWPWGLSFGHGVHMCLGRDLDGGLQPGPDTDPDDHQYGVVTLLVLALLSHGARWHPERAPQEDTSTMRPTWASYPIQFAGKPQ